MTLKPKGSRRVVVDRVDRRWTVHRRPAIVAAETQPLELPAADETPGDHAGVRAAA